MWLRSLVLAAALSIVFAGLADAQSGAPADPATPEFDYQRDATALIVRFEEVVGAIEDADRGRSLEIYGDGRFEIHYPHYMKRAGDYQGRLSPADLRRFMRKLVRRGAADVDPVSLKARKREADRAADTFFASFDDVTTVIEVNLEGYRRPGEAGPPRAIRQRLSWDSLRSDAKRHRQIRELQDMVAVQELLLEFMQRPDLVPPPGPGDP